MTELFSNLVLGFGVAFTPVNLMLCLIGALVGTLIGVLPGIGTIATVAMLLPITFGLPPVGALIMLAGIYYGAQYGGSTTSILVNIPGEATSVVTTLDGFQMAKQGRAGPALAIAAIGSFAAGCFATVLIALLGAPLSAEDAGRLLALVAVDEMRDGAWTLMTREDADRHVDLWRDLVRRAPRELLPAAGSLLAFAAWLDGDGALAWCALDRVASVDPGYRMAGFVGALLERAVPPSTWELVDPADPPAAS